MKKLFQKKYVLISMLVIISFFVVNIIISKTTGIKVLSNTISHVQKKLAPNNEEVKSVELYSDNYNDKVGGSYKIDKSAQWTGTDTAKIEFKVDTKIKASDTNKDVVLVLDISSSMSGEKIAKVKSDAKALTDSLLSNKDNRVALITFETTSNIEHELTNDKDTLISKIDSLDERGMTNYNQALINVSKVLTDYEKSDNRELIVLFLTDGFPNKETPNQITQYKLLKEKYSYMTINGIQYEMGINIVDDLKMISDVQYIANMETLNNILFVASLSPKYYEEFEIVDYIHDDYFYIESIDDINIPFGKVKLEEENGIQKVIWIVGPNEFRTGSSAIMTINLKLKEQYVGSEGYYPTNKGVEVRTKLPEEDEIKKISDETPILKSGYKVYYETNTPKGCTLEDFEENHYAFESVKISDKKFNCDGYQFKGWEIVEDVTKVNDDYFIMPSNDVTLKARWTKNTINKSMDGIVYTKPTLYETIEEQSVLDNMASKYVTSPIGIDFSKISSDTNGKGVYTLSSTIGDKYPIYYYRGAVDNNNVIFAKYCWKIVRTTEKGGVKLIYNGAPDSNGACNNTGSRSQIGTSKFASDFNSIAHLGYMYGDKYYYGSYSTSSTNKNSEYLYGNDVVYENGMYTLTDTIEATLATDYSLVKDKHHYTCFNTTGECTSVYYLYYELDGDANYLTLKDGDTIESALERMVTSSDNTNNSKIKTVIDNWFKNNLLDYTEYLEDAIYCNDRRISDYGGWKKDSNSDDCLIFDAWDRAEETYQPDLKCNLSDSFTVSKENGNGALTYPVALINGDEIMYAGAIPYTSNTSNYLTSGTNYWTMTPSIYYMNYSVTWFFNSNGGYYYGTSNGPLGVRSVLTLVTTTQYTDGDGTANNPYIIE